MTLATPPRLVLLDEPAAGMTGAERGRRWPWSRPPQEPRPCHHADRARHGFVDALDCPVSVMEVGPHHSRRQLCRSPPGPACARGLSRCRRCLSIHEVVAGHGGGAVLGGLSLGVARGETVALLGRNGVGKTTLLRCIMGLVHIPTARSVARDSPVRPDRSRSRGGVLPTCPRAARFSRS